MPHRVTKNKETIIFLHIPKTAGTTLDQIIYRHYPFNKVYQTGSIAQQGVRDYINMNKAAQANYRILKGHLNFGIHQHVPNQWAYFTFLREPIDRTISHFYFIAQNKNHTLYNLIQEQKMGIKEYLEAGLDPMLFNAHTRLLSGVWDNNPAGTCTTDDLRMAKENLKAHIKVIGLTERFDESLLLLRQAFGWHSIYYIPQNVTSNRPKKDELDQETLMAIENANELDLELYEYALPLFEEQIERYGPDFTRDFLRFRFRNRFLGPVLGLYWDMRKISVRVFIKEKLAHLKG
jgi:hypothetical protein